MKIRVFRIVHYRHIASAWTGQGAAKFGGRWNSKSVPVVYASSSLSLASLKLLVHLEIDSGFRGFRFASIELDSSDIQVLSNANLPAGWNRSVPSIATRAIGDAWKRAGKAPALRVPSAIVPTEFNYLINPAHAQFALMKRTPFERFTFDRRLFKNR